APAGQPARAAPPPGAPAEPPLDEATARRLLAGRFRGAGLRIVEDVPLGAGAVELVVDGFDPARRVGYEYVAAEEAGVELDGAERAALAALPDARVLVIDAAGERAVVEAAASFLAGLGAPEAPDQR